MQKIERYLRYLAKTHLGVYLRNFFNIHPASMSLQYTEVSSDLFLWRDVSLWDNYFNISHLGLVLNPIYTEDYSALIVIFDFQGNKISEKKINLTYGKSQLVYINDIVGNVMCNMFGGTYAVFHLVNLQKFFNGKKICIAERGLASYKLKSDHSSFVSAVHGNANAIAYKSKTGSVRLLGCQQKKDHYYRVQLPIADSIYTELMLVNFMNQALKVNVFQYETSNLKKYLISQIDIPAGGLYVLDSRTDFDPNLIIEFESKLNFLRPVVFKHYTNHFDVLHG